MTLIIGGGGSVTQTAGPSERDSRDLVKELKGYTQDHMIESGNGIGVRIFVRRKPETVEAIEALPMRLPNGEWSTGEQEKYILSKYCNDIFNELEKQARRLDPKVIAEGKAVKVKFAECFKAAELGPIYMEPIDNGYEGPKSPWSIGSPWFKVATPIGYITIGWRKRVIEIDWTGTVLRFQPDPDPKKSSYRKKDTVPTGQEVFPTEDVTRGDTYVHAWGWEKAAEYLKALAAWPVRAEG